MIYYFTNNRDIKKSYGLCDQIDEIIFHFSLFSFYLCSSRSNRFVITHRTSWYIRAASIIVKMNSGLMVVDVVANLKLLFFLEWKSFFLSRNFHNIFHSLHLSHLNLRCRGTLSPFIAKCYANWKRCEFRVIIIISNRTSHDVLDLFTRKIFFCDFNLFLFLFVCSSCELWETYLPTTSTTCCYLRYF